MATLDLNADIGEDPGAVDIDEALLAVVTSANIACGGHAGDRATMVHACRVAVAHGVAIGAQVSYVDRAGFGRARLDVAAATLTAQLRTQLEDLESAALDSGSAISYLKPHGALYHAADADGDVARAILEAIDAHGRPLSLLTTPDGELARAGRAAGLAVHAEAFADRGYLADGRLVPRDHPQALLTDADAVRGRMDALIREGIIVAVDGSRIEVRPDSLCVHSDTPGAVMIAGAVRAALLEHGIALAPFAPASP